MKSEEITGRLEDWWWDEQNKVYWGYVYQDTKERFRDGAYIHTSRVLKTEDDKAYTLNSIYILGQKRIDSDEQS